MLQLVREVGNDLCNDPDWGSLILEDPNILGIEEFDDSAMKLRVWIKTQPMKQWTVSREYRRRFKQALEHTEAQVPFPQRQVWLNAPDGIKVNLSGKLRRAAKNSNRSSSRSGGNNSRNGRRPQTDRQPHETIGGSEDTETE